MTDLQIMNELIYNASQDIDFYYTKNYELIIYEINEYIEECNHDYILYKDDNDYRDQYGKLWAEAIEAREQGYSYMYEFYGLTERHYTNDLEQVFYDGVKGFKGISCDLTEYLSIYANNKDNERDYSDIKELAIKKYREREGK